MKTIGCLFLDIGGVLLSDGWGHEFRQQAAKKFHLDYAEMNQRHKLLFVVYEEGRITHVGILLNDKEIIHSSGKVRIDKIDSEGIVKEIHQLTCQPFPDV